MQNNNVDFEKADKIAVIRLDRPEKLNAVTEEMTEEIERLVRAINADDDVIAVLVTGTGKAFCAGSDISSLSEVKDLADYHKRPEYAAHIRAIEKPTVAAINGYAFGGGLELALSCDIRIACESATFSAAEIKLGWIGRGGSTQLLPRLIGYGNAARMIFTGRRIDASEARRIGLVEEVWPEAVMERQAREMVRSMAEYSPFTLKLAKRALRMSQNSTLDAGLAYEWELVSLCFGTQDKDEGIRAFQEHRKPNFKGR